MNLSIVVPAYNEEKLLPRCLDSIQHAMTTMGREANGLKVEVIVTDNNSTDSTGRIAQNRGATVVFESVNQISRARNQGAAVASGDWLLFLDADSVLHPRTLRELTTRVHCGTCVGGGCVVALDQAPLWARTGVVVWNVISRTMRWAAGSFFFCRRDAFEDLSGFSELMYASEEIDLSRRLKHWSAQRDLRFVILTAHPHVSSGRKLDLYSKREILLLCCRCLFRPGYTTRNKDQLGYFYDSRR